MNDTRLLYNVLSGQEPEYDRRLRRDRLRHLIAGFFTDEARSPFIQGWPGLECDCQDPAGHLADEILEKWRNWV